MRDLVMQPVTYWQAGGLLMIPLAGVCLALWTLFLRTRRDMAAALALPDDSAATLEAAVREGNPLQISERLTHFPLILRNAAETAARAFVRGRSASDAFEKHLEAYERHAGRNVTVLSTLTTLAPLLGLLGTVAGMITTFQGVADTAGDTSAQVASGISQALITTQFGLAIAIPGLWGVARLRQARRHMHLLFARCQVHLTIAFAQRSQSA